MSKLVSASIGILTLMLVGLMVAGCGGGSTDVGMYKISGSVTSSATNLEGIPVTLGGTGNATAFTNSFGNYSFSRLTNGTYTVTPAISNYTCTPKASVQTINGANISNVNFTATVSSPIFYVVDDSGNLGTVHIASGDVQLIGNTGVVMTDIAFDPNGTLYGVSYESPGKLYRIDKANAVATPMGVLRIINNNQNIVDATSLEFSNYGILYTATNYLYTVSTTTGAATTIGNGGFPYYSSGDLVSIGNQLYLSSKPANNSNDTDLVRLDTLTGNGTRIGSIGYPFVFGMATNDNVHLYGFSGTKIISIDINTGAGSVLFDISGKGFSNIYGAAFY